MNPEKPKMNVLDYGLASIMMPTTLAGSQIGGYILIVSPDLYIQILLTLLLAFLSYQTIKKGLELDRKEKAKKIAETNKVRHESNLTTGDPDIVEEEPMIENFSSMRDNINTLTSPKGRLNATQSVTLSNHASIISKTGENPNSREIVLGGKTYKLGQDDQ